MSFFIWFAALILAPIFVAKAGAWRKRVIRETLSWWAFEKMPMELRRSTLFLCEDDVSTLKPVPLHGRVDQVYKTQKGKLILVDTKSRKRKNIYESDVIQLSVYSLILSHQYKDKIADYGYIRVVIDAGENEKVDYIKVNLLSKEDVIKLYKRYMLIHNNHGLAECKCNKNFHM